MEDLPLGRIVALVPEFAVKDLPLGRTLMLYRAYIAEHNGKLLHLFSPSRTATLVPVFAVEDLRLDRIATLVPEFAVKICHWAEHSDVIICISDIATLNDITYTFSDKIL